MKIILMRLFASKLQLRHLLYVAAFSCILIQSCSKKQISPKVDNIADISDIAGRLKILGAGDHGTFQLISYSGLSPEIVGASNATGGKEDLVTYTGLPHQKFLITDLGTGYYTMQNVGSGKYIESCINGSTYIIRQNSKTGSDAQLWSFLKVGNYYKAINKADGLAATNHGNATAEGSPISLEPYINDSSQWWTYKQL